MENEQKLRIEHNKSIFKKALVFSFEKNSSFYTDLKKFWKMFQQTVGQDQGVPQDSIFSSLKNILFK